MVELGATVKFITSPHFFAKKHQVLSTFKKIIADTTKKIIAIL